MTQAILPVEAERIQAEGQLEKANHLMMRRFNELFSAGMLGGELSGEKHEAMEKFMGEIVGVSATMYQHLQKQGSLVNLKVQLGDCYENFSQVDYIGSSLVGALLAYFVSPQKRLLI